MPDEISFEEAELSAAEANAIAVAALIEGARTNTWKTRLTKGLLDKLMDRVRASIASDENISQAITAVLGGTIDGVPTTGVVDQARRQANGLINTAILATANQARLLTFQKNANFIKWIQQVSILDNRTSNICIAYSGQVWDVETLLPIGGSTLPFRGGPPRHFNCRSMLIPILRSAAELGPLAAGLTREQKKLLDGKVPEAITFDQWLTNKPRSFQDKLLGPTRARLWRNGSITLTQLVDMRGNPLTLEQLEKKIQNRRGR